MQAAVILSAILLAGCATTWPDATAPPAKVRLIGVASTVDLHGQNVTFVGAPSGGGCETLGTRDGTVFVARGLPVAPDYVRVTPPIYVNGSARPDGFSWDGYTAALDAEAAVHYDKTGHPDIVLVVRGGTVTVNGILLPPNGEMTLLVTANLHAGANTVPLVEAVTVTDLGTTAVRQFEPNTGCA